MFKLLKSFPGMGAFDHLEWTYDGAFEQLFSLGSGEFSKNSDGRGVARGGGGCLSFDLTDTLLMKKAHPLSNKLKSPFFRRTNLLTIVNTLLQGLVCLIMATAGRCRKMKIWPRSGFEDKCEILRTNFSQHTSKPRGLFIL